MHGRWIYIAALMAAALAAIVYWPAHVFGFIWDDTSYLVYSEALRDPAQWRTALFRAPTGETVFRPLTLISFMAQLWSGQVDPEPFHVVNIALHGANVVLV